MHDLIYLDHAATTPLDPRVLDAMLPFLREDFGNAASRQHVLGQRAEAAVERARQQVAAALHADPREIVFTSGATEASNLALLGLPRSPASEGRRHVVTTTTEHKATLDPCRHLESQGFDVTYLTVDACGHLDLDQLADALRDDTLLVTILHGNNEVGTLHPIAEIGRLCREKGVFFHTDATQTFGKLPLHVENQNLDLVSLSAHKIYGPKGVGALYVRRKRPRVRLEPLVFGGGHERGYRSGTLNVPGIVGLGEAARIATLERDVEQPRTRTLRDALESALRSRLTGVTINGDSTERLAGITNLSFSGCNAESLMRRIPRVCVSTASACTSTSVQPSYVLNALGLDAERIAGSLRFSLGRHTEKAAIDEAIELLVDAVTAERADLGGALPTCERA